MAHMVSPLGPEHLRRPSATPGASLQLLAPAGSFPAFEAALEQGADAVYVGAPGCNARALSRDFTMAEIDAMIQQAHGCGVQLYIAMNSLVKESELPRVIEALACFEQMRPDALIIQDLGLLYLVQTWFPGLPLHASTLMSVHNSTGARELTNLGFERVVLARELTIEEMAQIHRQSGAELEVFVHGAMCFSYSGLCMFSSLHGGKSSLRGQCVQPCRRHYSWLAGGKGQAKGRRSDGKYVFSMNDLCGVDMLPELRDAGVRCLKIEGRMKSASYVANTVAAYRMALDSIDAPEADQERILREAHGLLDAAMARKRSSGYFLSDQPREAITPGQSGTSGRLLGRVDGLHREKQRHAGKRFSFRLTLTEAVQEGDRLRLHDDKSGERTSFTLRSLSVQGRHRKTAIKGETVQIGCIAPFKGQIGQAFKGSLYKVDVGARIVAERSGQQRRKRLADKRIVPDYQKVEKIVHHLHWKNIAEGKKKKSGKSRTGRQPRRFPGKAMGRGRQRELPWWVLLANLADVRHRLPVRAARIGIVLNRENIDQLARLGKKIRKNHGQIVWRLLPVIHEADQQWYCRQIDQLVAAGFRRFELGHCSQYGLFLTHFKQETPLELFGFYTQNALNSASLRALGHLGYRGALFSLETEKINLLAALSHYRQRNKRARARKKGPDRLEVGLYVYGRPPLFTARLNSDHFRYRQQIISPREEQYRIEHHDGLTRVRSTLPFSLLKWHQELTGTGLDYLVVDLSGGPLREEVSTVNTLLAGSKKHLSVLAGNFEGTLV